MWEKLVLKITVVAWIVYVKLNASEVHKIKSMELGFLTKLMDNEADEQ